MLQYRGTAQASDERFMLLSGPCQNRVKLLSSFVFVEKSKVRCNFIEMSSVYCAGFDLRAELEKGSVTSEPSQIPKRKRRPV